jgi:hypothetical protein
MLPQLALRDNLEFCGRGFLLCWISEYEQEQRDHPRDVPCCAGDRDISELVIITSSFWKKIGDDISVRASINSDTGSAQHIDEELRYRS